VPVGLAALIRSCGEDIQLVTSDRLNGGLAFRVGSVADFGRKYAGQVAELIELARLVDGLGYTRF
jgi:hypothetical protein